jgi:peptide/nickel transport system permease protein
VKRYLAKRLATTVVLIWFVATTLFLMVYILPGDPANVILGAGEVHQPTQEQVERVRAQLGLDRPLHVQYGDYLTDLARLDFGQSLITRRPVGPDVSTRLIRTLQIIIPAIILSTIAGIILGVAAAQRRFTISDSLLSGLGLFGFSIPTFVVGYMLVLIVAVNMGLLPSSGYIEFSVDPVRSLRYMVLPVVTLATVPLAMTMRKRMRVTMSCDHRVVDGATGAKFLQTLRRLLENPLMLVY